MPSACIFDLDGTLLDTIADIAGSSEKVLAAFGLPPNDLEAYRFFVGNGMKKMVERATPPETSEATRARILEEVKREYANALAVHTRPYPGIENMLARLAALGLPLMVLSNKPDPYTQLLVRHYFQDIPFVSIQGQRPDVATKPSPEAVLHMTAKARLAPHECMFIGDSEVDMKTACAAKMHAVGVAWGFRPVAELLEHGATAILQHPEDIFPLL